MARFMTAALGAAGPRDASTRWPDPERKASKLQDFWDWIAMIARS